MKDEAIAVLEDAAKRDRIREDGRWMLVQWEQELKRWAASLPHAEKLTAERPDNLAYRLANLRALHGVGRDADGRAMVDAAQKHFADLLERGRGGRRAQTQLADVCVECQWFDKAIVLYPLALTEERRYNRSGRANAELSRLYGQYSRCLSGAGRHDEAIDAASSAVVIWGSTDSNREGALQALREALAAIPELPAWEEKWESAAAKDGSDAPVLRGMLGDLHLERKEPDRALHHLLIARRIQPDDLRVHAAIVRAAEMKQDAAGTADAMAMSLHHLPRQPDLYPRLADVFKGLGRADDAERALTGLVEFAPTEADGHQRLAVLRTNAGRHDEAAVQWRHIVRIRSADPAGWFELARSLSRAGRKDEARAVLDEAARTPWGPAQRKAIESVSKEIEHEKT
jgi:tetratricopeptide (TPR) repeat protein